MYGLTEIYSGTEELKAALRGRLCGFRVVPDTLLRRYADEALTGRPRHLGRFRSAVEDRLPRLLPHGKASASNVAQHLGMSTRPSTSTPSPK
jgi:hypothetical protein